MIEFKPKDKMQSTLSGLNLTINDHNNNSANSECFITKMV